MKIKNFFLAGLAVLALSACSDDDKDQLVPGTGVEGYLSLQITAPQTRTTGTPTDNGVAKESAIENVTVVFTNAAGDITHVVTPPSIENNITSAFKVAIGTYKVYALVNNPIAESDLTGNINDIIETAATVENITSGYKDGKFFMVNARNSSSQVEPDVVISQSNTQNNPARATIAVDRVATKIVDATDYATSAPTLTPINSETTPSFITAVEVIGFAPLNINKQFNLLQTWNTNGVLTTPLDYTAGTDNISKQFFAHIGEYTELGYHSTNRDSIVSVTDLKKDVFKFDTIYTTENSPKIIDLGTKLTSGRGETTGVIYKVQAKNASGNVNTFYGYRGKVYGTLTEIEALPDFSGVALPTAVDELRGYGIQVYEGGIMYYTYFIKDPNAAHQYNGMNYYAVMRNSIYNLSVKNITKVGDDVPGGSIDPVDPNKPTPTGPTDPTDPTDPTNPPIDFDEAYIDVEVTINPWILNTIDIDF